MGCPVRSGPYRCTKTGPHTEHECESPPYDLDAQRELRRAARRIEALTAALRALATVPCLHGGGTLLGVPCACCAQVRAIARKAVGR